jgi:hypothetical protein
MPTRDRGSPRRQKFIRGACAEALAEDVSSFVAAMPAVVSRRSQRARVIGIAIRPGGCIDTQPAAMPLG